MTDVFFRYGQAAIPKVLHHLWPGEDEFPATRAWWGEDRQATFHAWRESWMAHHPDWSMCFSRLPHTRDPQVNQVLARGDLTVVVKSDVLRWQLLLERGGVYSDTDVECLRPLDERWVPARAGVTLTEEWPRTDLMSPSVVVAPPGSAAVHAVRNGLLEVVGSVAASTLCHEPHILTGPFAVTRILRGVPGVNLLPAWTAFPDKVTGPEPAYVRNYWTGNGTLEGWCHVDRLGPAGLQAQAHVRPATIGEGVRTDMPPPPIPGLPQAGRAKRRFRSPEELAQHLRSRRW